MKIRMMTGMRTLLLLAVTSVSLNAVICTQAEARPGRGGRSIGRSSGPSHYSNPRPYTAPPQQAAPSSYGNMQRSAPPPIQQPMGMTPNRGGFLRNVAGGMAGGFLGSMLFNSIGHASGMGSMGYGGNGGGGGFGILELALFGFLAFIGFRWWKNRQMQTANDGPQLYDVNRYQSQEPIYERVGAPLTGLSAGGPTTGGIDSEMASDIFFRIQGAYTRRDLSSVRDLLGTEVYAAFSQEIEDLKRARRTNKLENITVRRTDVVTSWQEGDMELSKVRFTANLLDYTVDDASGAVVDGSDTVPVKFEENWTFEKPLGSGQWRLVGLVNQ